MISFRLFFASLYQPPAEAFVMLDCVLEAAPYPGVRRLVRCLDIYRSDEEVEVPSVDGLLADKLLTLGPATLGIPLGKGKQAHRLKHVFDVALLARQPHDGPAIRRWLEACLVQENTLQRKQCTPQEVALDTRAFLSAPLAWSECPDPASLDPTGYMYETAQGFAEFREHLFKTHYTWERFCEDCRLVLRTLEETGL
jgi:hypothetical protein